MLEHAFELRYQVYCLECGYLDAAAYADGRESDIYDDDSAHFFAHNLRRELVGYVRLVPADMDGRFPWELYCKHEGQVALPPAAEAAEVSRLMVRRDYRRRRGDILSGVNTTGGDQQRGGALPAGERRMESPQILLTLYRQMYQHSLQVGIRYWYAAMERPLARSLQRMAFTFEQIGPETDYFGPVAPFMTDLRRLEANLESRNPALLAWMQKPDAVS
jgi:N-acyl amino acid synthase of PEP-CTERM/exosortase system